MTTRRDSEDPVGTALTNVSGVVPTPENAKRLWRCYQRAYLDDEQLVRRTCDPTRGIDGLTEALGPDDMLACMQMRDTATFEHRSMGADDCDGFVILRYATQAASSICEFQAYFLDGVFRRSELRFQSSDSRTAFYDRMEQGKLVYLSEFVSSGAPGITLALVIAAYWHVSQDVFASPSFGILGKCLDEVRIGSYVNALGNRPIRTFVTSLGLKKMARCEQHRRIKWPARRELMQLRLPIDCRDDNEVDVVLDFALYLGSAAIVRDIATKRDQTKR